MAPEDKNEPPYFRTGLEQTTHYHQDGTPYSKIVEIVTEGAELYDEDTPWEDLDEDQRATWKQWLSDDHDLEVAIAKATPYVRKRYDELARECVWDQEWESRPGLGQALLERLASEASLCISTSVTVNMADLLENQSPNGEVCDVAATFDAVRQALVAAVDAHETANPDHPTTSLTVRCVTKPQFGDVNIECALTKGEQALFDSDDVPDIESRHEERIQSIWEDLLSVRGVHEFLVESEEEEEEEAAEE